MIVIDTSVWIDHFRQGDPRVALYASHLEIAQHPFVTGELAMGNLSTWRRTVDALSQLPQAEVLAPNDLLDFMETNRLMGTGIGFVDGHLLGSCAQGGHELWTRDRRLTEQAERLRLLHAPG